MKILVDTDRAHNNVKDKDIFIYLLSLYLKCPITKNTFTRAIEEGYAYCKDDGTIVSTKLGRDKMEQHFSNTETIANQQGESFEEIANAMREIYPAGKKPGTNYMWRDSTIIIAQRLRALVKKYNVEFTKEEAVEATKRYIESFNGNYKYMQILKYFIGKQRPVEGEPAEQNSQFLSFLQNKETENVSSTNDWTANLV